MPLTENMIRFFVGGSLIAIVSLISKTKNPLLSGIVLLFPAVSLVSFYFIGSTVDAAQLKQITKFSMYALIPTFIFIMTLYNVQGTFSIAKSLIAALVMWVVSAIALVVIAHA